MAPKMGENQLDDCVIHDFIKFCLKSGYYEAPTVRGRKQARAFYTRSASTEDLIWLQLLSQ